MHLEGRMGPEVVVLRSPTVGQVFNLSHCGELHSVEEFVFESAIDRFSNAVLQ